jgi:hypothetical protein
MFFQATSPGFAPIWRVFRPWWAGSAALLLLLGLLPGLAGCRADRVTVNPNDPKSPQYAYRLDELALLQMAADDIQELERQKRYGQIYDDFAGPEFKAGTSRRRFLIMANCVETYLGGVQEFDRGNTGFKRSFVKTAASKKRRTMDILRREAQRDHGPVAEQLVFTGNGVNFKLNSLYWFARDKSFLQCIANSARLEAETTPPTELESESDSAPKPDGDSTAPAPAAESGTPSASSPSDSGKAAPDEAPRAGAAAGPGIVESSRPAADSNRSTPATKPSSERKTTRESTPPTHPSPSAPDTEHKKPPTPDTQPSRHSGSSPDTPALRGKVPEHPHPPTPAMPLDLVAPPRNEPSSGATPPTPN